jgi:hypothetical protein
MQFMDSVMGMHGQMLKYTGIALQSVGLPSKAEQYSETYINCCKTEDCSAQIPRTVLDVLQYLSVVMNTCLYATHSRLLAANNSVLQPLLNMTLHWLVMVGKLILPVPINCCL